MVARRMERRLLEGFSLFRLLAGLRAADTSSALRAKIEKADNNKVDEFTPLPVDRKVLVEYYKHLGRGPL